MPHLIQGDTLQRQEIKTTKIKSLSDIKKMQIYSS